MYILNPTFGVVTLPSNSHYEVYNSMAIRVKNGFDKVVDLSDLPEGFYIIKTEKSAFTILKK